MPLHCRYDGARDRNGEPNGVGTAVFDKGKYRGEWQSGLFHGKGELVLNNGMRYVGDFESNKMHGYGKLRFSDGRLYEGNMKEGKMHGLGTLTTPSGTYIGQFVEGERHGKGTMTYVDGSSYAGDWKSDRIGGFGKLCQADGVTFEGKWLSGVMNGIIHMTKPSGSVYRQEYFDGRLSKSERVKAAPSFIERLLFNTAKAAQSALLTLPAGAGEAEKAAHLAAMHARAVEMMHQRPNTAPHYSDPGSTGDVPPQSDPPSTAPARVPTTSSTRDPSCGEEDAGNSDGEAPKAGGGGVSRVKSLKDMKLAAAAAAAEAPLPIEKKSSLRRPLSAGTADGATALQRKVSFHGAQVATAAKARTTDSPDLLSPTQSSPRRRDCEASPADEDDLGVLEAMESGNSFSATVSPRGGAELRSPHGGGGGAAAVKPSRLVLQDPPLSDINEDSSEAMTPPALTPEQRAKVDALAALAQGLGSVPLPPALLTPTALAAAAAAAGSPAAEGDDAEEEDDVFSEEARQRRRLSRYESKLDLALEKSLVRRASLAQAGGGLTSPVSAASFRATSPLSPLGNGSSLASPPGSAGSGGPLGDPPSYLPPALASPNSAASGSDSSEPRAAPCNDSYGFARFGSFAGANNVSFGEPTSLSPKGGGTAPTALRSPPPATAALLSPPLSPSAASAGGVVSPLVRARSFFESTHQATPPQGSMTPFETASLNGSGSSGGDANSATPRMGRRATLTGATQLTGAELVTLPAALGGGTVPLANNGSFGGSGGGGNSPLGGCRSPIAAPPLSHSGSGAGETTGGGGGSFGGAADPVGRMARGRSVRFSDDLSKPAAGEGTR